MNLKHIIDLTHQLHPVSILRNLQTDSTKVFLDTEFPTVIQLLAQLAAVVCWDAQFLIDYDAGDSLLLTRTLDPGFLLIQQEAHLL